MTQGRLPRPRLRSRATARAGAAATRRPRGPRAWIAALALAAGCGPGEPAVPAAPPGPPPPPAAGRLAAPPDIVLVTLDTLRRDHLGCYGYFRETTPTLDALAAEGLVFERAVAAMASTLPSHLTMLTGLYPHQHGMRSNLRGASQPFEPGAGVLTAAKVLADCGYRTAGFVSAAPLSTATGIDAGFGEYDQPGGPRTGGQRRARTTVAQAVEWLESQAGATGPMFLWVHLFDPHEPSDPEAPYDGAFTTDERQREWIRARGIDPAQLVELYAHSKRVRRHFFPTVATDPDAGMRITLDDVADLMNRYDGEVRAMDAELSTLFAALRRLGRYDGALIAVVADHGQSLGENAWLGHGTITDVNTLVPLILRLPSGLVPQPRRIPQLVSLVDLMPTLLGRFELPGSEALRAQFEGEDLLSGSFTRDDALSERTADELRDGESGEQYALHSGRWKLIHRPDGADELYDLEGDGEGTDVSAAHADVVERLRARTRALLARRPAAPADAAAGAPDAELLRNLEELGYAGD